MKDDYKRRRKVERPLIKILADVDSSAVYTAVHQESLDTVSEFVIDVSAQGQEFIATSSIEWWIEVYGLASENGAASFDLDSASEISDEGVIPDKTREALWRAVPRDSEIELMGNIKFLAPDVLGFVRPETRPTSVSTWNVRSGQILDSVILRGKYTFQIICKICNTEFVVGSADGHLFSFEHEGGHNLRETGRIWKAHTAYINTISVHNGIILTTSADWTARLWDAETKKRLAVLYHDGKVFHGAISDQYIVTSSNYSATTWEKRELRIYRNCEGYPLTKILRAGEGMFAPTLLDGGRVLCVLRGEMDENVRPVVRNTLAVVDFENEVMLASLKVGCRNIGLVEVLSDGRLVATGGGGCRGVIATLPHYLRRLISSKAAEQQSKVRRRRKCTLM